MYLTDEEREALQSLDEEDGGRGPAVEDGAQSTSSGGPRALSLLDTLPGGLHFRPMGKSGWVLILWECIHGGERVAEPAPIQPLFNELYPEFVVRGASRLVDGFEQYIPAVNRCQVDGGYYCRTANNQPLIGPYGPQGSYVITGLGGFGIMCSAAAGELLASHVLADRRSPTAGPALPEYAHAFDPTQVLPGDEWSL